MRMLLIAAVCGAGILSLALAIYAGVRANRAVAAILDMVNRHADPGAPRETGVNRDPITWNRVSSRYRAIDPGAPLIWRYRLWTFLMVLSGLLAFAVLGGLADAGSP
ncbi:hypothetical protein G5B46_18275 [Caulobacter sp. 602-2]|uniref:Uncharacterized protein n=1 Tax=Caulobacter sp. 602-2 TaxID=2710887 RepID=A0A6G4R1G9_9CAUL|nr:hypothetical protein [Caulobacter sp. 602-2]NGM51563.1 hypothetical protein [Caulobacter sp. 602-2]